MGATGILRFFFFSIFFLSKQLIQRPLTRTLPVFPAPIVAEDGYSCPNGTHLSFFILLAYILSWYLLRERIVGYLLMLIPSLQKYIPDFYGGLTPLAAEMTKDFFVSARVYPEEYHGYCHL
jgi:hypothetical protein